jgi:cell filamentation protein
MLLFIASIQPLDFSTFAKERREEYFVAVRHGLDRNYKPMEKVFRTVIDHSLKAYEG